MFYFEKESFIQKAIPGVLLKIQIYIGDSHAPCPIRITRGDWFLSEAMKPSKLPRQTRHPALTDNLLEYSERQADVPNVVALQKIMLLTCNSHFIFIFRNDHSFHGGHIFSFVVFVLHTSKAAH